MFNILLGVDDEIQEDCLTDIWVSSGRSMFLDLTAGPFQWGPSVLSDGVSYKFFFLYIYKNLPKKQFYTK